MYTIKNKKSLPDSALEIEIVIKAEEIEHHWKGALEHIGQNAQLDGFRKGHIPEKVLVSKVGEMTVLEEAVEHALSHIYAEIVEKEKINPIGHPQVIITKIARGTDAEVTLKTDVLPTFSLPDYKKIVAKVMKEKEEVIVEEKEVTDVIEELKRYKAKQEKIEETEVVLDEKFLETLGGFKTIEEFKIKIKENIEKEKTQKNKEKKRLEAIEKVLEEIKIEVPKVLIEQEQKEMLAEFSHELTRLGGTLEQYKKESGKTDEDMKTDWKDKAIARVKTELLLIEIAKTENIKPNEEEVTKEVATLETHYPDAPKERLISFVEDIKTKEAIFNFFENLGESK